MNITLGLRVVLTGLALVALVTGYATGQTWLAMIAVLVVVVGVAWLR